MIRINASVRTRNWRDILERGLAGLRLRGGLDELLFTVGALFGPFPIGGGFQFAVAPAQRLAPALTPENQSNIIFSGRIVF
jgi:hypothetical protein